MVAEVLLVLFFSFSMMNVAFAEIYRWVDDKGNIQFSDRPLNNKTQTVNVNTQLNSYGGGGVLERQRDLLDEYQADDVQEQKDKQQAVNQAVRDKRLQARCINAKDQLSNYKRGAIYRLDDDGERIYYSEEERTATINKFQQLIQENCQ